MKLPPQRRFPVVSRTDAFACMGLANGLAKACGDGTERIAAQCMPVEKKGVTGGSLPAPQPAQFSNAARRDN